MASINALVNYLHPFQGVQVGLREHLVLVSGIRYLSPHPHWFLLSWHFRSQCISTVVSRKALGSKVGVQLVHSKCKHISEEVPNWWLCSFCLLLSCCYSFVFAFILLYFLTSMSFPNSTDKHAVFPAEVKETYYLFLDHVVVQEWGGTETVPVQVSLQIWTSEKRGIFKTSWAF